MTTTETAAAWNVQKLLLLSAFISFIGIGLAGCGTGNFLGSGSLEPTATKETTGNNQASAPRQTQRTSIEIATIMGASGAINAQISQELAKSLSAQRYQVVSSGGSKADYVLRGFMVAAKGRRGTKVTYIWDLYDSSDKRINRLTGEELARGGTAKNPWSAVKAPLIQKIVAKASSYVARSIPDRAPGQNLAVASARNTTAGTAAGTTTGSISRANTVITRVSSVVGAPGDGSQALATALTRELTKNGIVVDNRPSLVAYRVEGKVSVGAASGGMQPIQIDWNVKDPKGKRLGTVSQKNKIKAGSLDGKWGQDAEHAAAAAAVGIIKLLPTKQAAQSTN